MKQITEIQLHRSHCIQREGEGEDKGDKKRGKEGSGRKMNRIRTEWWQRNREVWKDNRVKDCRDEIGERKYMVMYNFYTVLVGNIEFPCFRLLLLFPLLHSCSLPSSIIWCSASLYLQPPYLCRWVLLQRHTNLASTSPSETPGCWQPLTFFF